MNKNKKYAIIGTVSAVVIAAIVIAIVFSVRARHHRMAQVDTSVPIEESTVTSSENTTKTDVKVTSGPVTKTTTTTPAPAAKKYGDAYFTAISNKVTVESGIATFVSTFSIKAEDANITIPKSCALDWKGNQATSLLYSYESSTSTNLSELSCELSILSGATIDTNGNIVVKPGTPAQLSLTTSVRNWVKVPVSIRQAIKSFVYSNGTEKAVVLMAPNPNTFVSGYVTI